MSSRFWFSSIVIVTVSCGQANSSEGRGAASLPTNDPVAVTPVPDPVPPELVNLLTRSDVDIAVSSVYRSLSSQVAALVDGNLETAWNSATGQLVGSWIDVRLPEAVTVSAIELTVGYTKVTPTSDLFTGNHRVTRVRVLRGGTEIGVFALDPRSRELQTLPISGPGGIYRIEVLEVVPGTRANWREVCISELRVIGHSPESSSPTSVPRFAVGTLPAPRVVPGTTDRSEVQRLLMVELPTFERLWSTLESDIRRYQATSPTLVFRLMNNLA